jgi:hypothetical protein
MFTPEKEPLAAPAERIALSMIVTLILTVWGTISLGLFPGFFLELARAVSLLS